MQSPPSARLPAAAVAVLLGTAGSTLAAQSILADAAIAGNLVSIQLWERLTAFFGGDLQNIDGRLTTDVGLLPLLLLGIGVSGAAWFGGAAWMARRQNSPYSDALARWGLRGWSWWLILGAWELLRVFAVLSVLDGLESLLLSITGFVVALALGGWLATFFAGLSRPAQEPPRHVAVAVWLAAGLYAAVFTAMNWQLYFGLLVPHGDSAMYEEHLWNLTNGKGFRSYLDQGLFLGEHLQVSHVLLLPLYLIWPSHLLLELCESAALACGAVPVYWIARRHTGSERAGFWLAVAYLLYVPMQFLDIAIDLKTFRPDAFGIPALLFALDQIERRRLWAASLLLLVALSAQESYAMVLAPLGVWLAFRGTGSSPEPRRAARWFGAGLAVFAAAYLLLAVTMIIPWFRSGADVHYSQYFGELGGSPGELISSTLREPGAALGKFFSARTLYYALALLLPLGFLPLLSAGRLAISLPMFAVLSLMELSPEPGQQQLLIPFHHFHAPLVAIVVWAAAAGLGRLSRSFPRVATSGLWSVQWGMHFAWCTALTTGLFYSLSPLGLAFWDPGSTYHWRKLYAPGPRAEYFPRVYEQIPQDSRVASTDLIHPRFTHHERSYDYSAYPRAVNRNQPGAPPDTDYIVIDVHGRYNEITSPQQIREYREEPEAWEVLPDVTDGYFIVLKRKTVSDDTAGAGL